MLYRKHHLKGAGFGATAEPGDHLPIQQAGEVWAPQEWSIHWHAHDGWELYFQARGKSKWEIGGTVADVMEGGAYLIREGIRHRLKGFSRAGSHFYWVVFPASSLPKVLRTSDCWHKEYTILSQAQVLLHPMQGIIREVAMNEPWRAEACRWYLATLCTTFVRIAERCEPHRSLNRHPGAERAQRLLASRLEHPWRLEELARLSGVSPQHLIEMFCKEYGQTPMRALKQMRLEEARRRLKQTGKSVTEIAMELGFSSSQHLAFGCREHFHLTPTQLRNE